MAEAAVTSAAGWVRQVAVPPEARALSTLPGCDYEDAFVVDVRAVDARSAEQWARYVVEEAPADIRRTLRAGWSGLGIELDADPPERRVLGLRIRRDTPDFVLLAADSRNGMGELLLARCHGKLLFCTFVQHETAVGRAAWARVEPYHVPLVRRILEDAASRCRRSL